jgi:hypothetical protein
VERSDEAENELLGIRPIEGVQTGSIRNVGTGVDVSTIGVSDEIAACKNANLSGLSAREAAPSEILEIGLGSGPRRY